MMLNGIFRINRRYTIHKKKMVHAQVIDAGKIDALRDKFKPIFYQIK